MSMPLATAEAQNAQAVATLNCTGSTASERVACMRSKSVAQLAAAIPNSWNTPGLWGLELLTPAGMNYAGLPIIDGRILTMSFEDALKTGLVDIPFMNGNMGQECDLAPDQNVEGFSLVQWQALLNQSLTGWRDASLPLGVYNMYLDSATVDPQYGVQRAYGDFNTDYGLTCANSRLAVEAKAGAFRSPIYLYVNQWPPQSPQVGLGYNTTWAYHTWDYMAAMERWQGVQPQPLDAAFSRLLQDLWYDLMADGKLDPSTGWRSVEDVPGFPAHYGTFVIATADKPPFFNSSFLTDYKAGNCTFLSSFGFDARFWWVN